VWIGNDDGKRMKKVTGGSLPAKLWHDVMLHAHRNSAPLPLPGAGGTGPRGVVASLPWHDPQNSSNGPFLRRLLSIFSGL
jgi:penicillin-binding protein 1A